MKLLIIDMDSVMFSIGAGNKVLDPLGEPIKEDGKFVYVEKTPEELIASADFMMNDILKSSGATHYIAYVKGKNTQFRKDIKEDYKAKRPKQSPKWWTFVKSYLMLKWGIVEVNDIEVDDAVSITKKFYPEAYIAAIDQDLLSLEGTHFNWRKKEWITTTKEQAEDKIWDDMIIGQSGDGIQGIPGKGEAFVKKIKGDKRLSAMDVYSLYFNHFGEEESIRQFYQNYFALKILQEYDGFVPAEPIVYEKNIEDVFN